MAVPHRCIEDNHRSRRSTREHLTLMFFRRIVHNLLRWERLKVSPRHETGRTICWREIVDHENAPREWPSIGTVSNIDMKLFVVDTWMQRPSAHATEPEWVTNYFA